ncbi:MAG: phage regulatory CII family protein [Desulfobaccales bacterium]
MNMADYRALPLEEQRNFWKRLLSATVPRGDVKATAYAAGLSDYTLYKMRDPECESHNAIRAELPLIMEERQDFRLLYAFCELCGQLAVPLPQPLQSLDEISRHITRVFKECAGACQAVIDAAAPESPSGLEITWEEFQAIRREIRAAQRQLAALEEAARLKAVKHPSWPRRLLQRLAAVKRQAGGSP